tara:strand:+ start:235 stop:513 length:279 start_codon:yes stop_codon:yes gene_type:complete
LVSFQLSIFRCKKDGVRIVSSQDVIDGNVPKAMSDFFQFVIAFYIEAYVQPIIIRNPELISVTVDDIFGVVEIVTGHGIGHGPSCLIGQVCR